MPAAVNIESKTPSIAISLGDSAQGLASILAISIGVNPIFTKQYVLINDMRRFMKEAPHCLYAIGSFDRARPLPRSAGARPRD
jgi:hypothetical protein